MGKPSVHLGGEVLEVDAWHPGAPLPGVVDMHLFFFPLSFSGVNICQVGIALRCILAKKQTKVCPMFKFLGKKIPPTIFADSVGTPSAKAALAPDSLRSLTRGHTDPFSFPDDPSLPRQQAAGKETRTFIRLSISDLMSFSPREMGSNHPCKGTSSLG